MIGVYDLNPLRQDIEEIGQQFGIHFALNAVMSGERSIAGILFGEPLLVMKAGIPIAQKICQTPVPGKYDLVVASAGGHPKDINLYQAQKAMTHASLLAKPGGCIILVAACPEGSGSASYEAYMEGIHSHAEALERFQKDGFRVGPHKSFQIASIATRFEVMLISDIPNSTLKKLLLQSAGSVQEAVDQVVQNGKDGMRIAVLPHATSTIPIII
jgi:nickel-dependent lactate racemase